MSRPAALLLCLAFATPILAQQPPARAVAFDVVSVKRNAANAGIERFNSGITQRPDGGISMVNVPVGVMIGRAYGVRPIDMRGLPGWALSFDDATISSPLRRCQTRRQPNGRRCCGGARRSLQAGRALREARAGHLRPRRGRRDGRLGPGLTRVDTDCDAAERAGRQRPRAWLRPPSVSCPISRRRPAVHVPHVQAVMRDRLGDGQGALGDLLEGEGTMTALARVLLIGTWPARDRQDQSRRCLSREDEFRQRRRASASRGRRAGRRPGPRCSVPCRSSSG